MAGPRAVEPFHAMEVAREAGRRAAAGQSIIRFDVGQPDWGAPPAAIAAAQSAMAREALGYTDALGAVDLRAAIAAWYQRTHGLSIDPGRIVITTGASAAFQLAFLALLGEGDSVVMARPGYPPYRQILAALGFPALEVEARPEDGFQLTAALMASAPRARAALIASPANPTGAILSEADLRALAQACKARGTALISDEIYHGLSGGPREVSALHVDADAIVINSFSKTWAMTGWRVGWMIAPEALIGPIERLAQNLMICPPAISQVAARAALEDDAFCAEKAALLGANRARVLQALPQLGLKAAATPHGAFYALLDISAYSTDSFAFCRAALDEAGVALTPGVDFDPVRGARWARLSFARSTAEVDDGLARLRDWLNRARR